MAGPRGGIDVTVAHNARVWNYWLDGKDNYAADRAAGDQVREMFPMIADVAREDRRFLGRAVRYLTAEAGMRQFLDVGTGLPTAENTHQVAQAVDPGARVVYVDNDPLVLAHARVLLVGTDAGRTAYVDADAHDPETILDAAASTLTFTEPVAVMLLGIINFIPDDADAARTIRTLMDAVPSGSHLALTHPTLELGGDANAEAMAFWNAHATPPITARSRDAIAALCAGLDLCEPGIVACSHWRPDDPPAEPVPQWALVARKP